MATSLQDVLAGSGLAGQEQQVRAVLAPQRTPWFLQPFIFLGAMIAALMFSIALHVFLHIDRWDALQQSLAGAAYLAAAVLLHRWRRNIFTDALALALSLGGHGFVLWAVDTATGPSANVAMVTFCVFLGLCAALYFLYRDGLHRYLTVVFVLVLAKAAFGREDLDLALHGFVLLAVGIAAWLLTRDRELPTWRPLAHGCCTGLVVLVLPLGHGRHDVFGLARHAMIHPWISSILVGIALLWILDWASRRPGVTVTPDQKPLVVLVTAGLAALSTPGLLAALFLAALGHATWHPRITLLGLSSLPFFLWKYYYSLHLDFLAKSGVLAASGAGLLVARWAIAHIRKETT